MKKFLKTTALLHAVVFVVLASVFLSACGKGSKNDKARNIINFTAVRGTDIYGGTVQLSWELADNFDRGNWNGETIVWVSKIDGEGTDIAGMDATDRAMYERNPGKFYNSCNFTGLPHGKTYVFSIKTIFPDGASGETSVSGEVELSFTVPTVPRVDLSAVICFGEATQVLWSAPSYNGGSPITNYEISTNGGETWTVYPATTTQINIPGDYGTGTGGKFYDFRIRAVNAYGPGEAFNEQTAADQVPAQQ